ncbi:MAG TPA: hypothetical protein VL527_10975 [Dongiaceae bacterium]|nr:hypothetical protein [Dongiaceae bacterium]
MFSQRLFVKTVRSIMRLGLACVGIQASVAMVPAAPIRQPVFQEPSLIPAAPSAVPDYFCTWNIQGYTCSYESSSQGMRRELNETNLFGTGKSPGWLNFYPRIRADLIFVMDDSWDVPLSGDSSYFGSLILNEERFPSYSGTPAERLKKLTAAVKARGWKGLGGWICAQPAPKFAVTNEPDYWTERLHWMREAGFAYWKVDWGQEAHNASWRQMITGIAHQEAPALIVEHAMTPEALKFADVYRTYDVENVMSVAVTIDRVAQLIRQKPAGSPTLINCEDEPYIAAGLGCLIGVMRHPHAGPLPDGKPDFVFPVAGRNLKRRLDEVVRAVRWHRIAAPMALGATADHIDAERLKDTWRLEPNETYTAYKPGDWREASAPARVTRGLALPEIKVGAGELTPFVLASRATNGAVAIATIGRTVGRQYQNPRAAITLDVENARGPFGIFGVFGSLTLKFDHPLPHVRILAQDLAADYSTDITADVLIRGNELTLSGELISKIGLSAASANDLSEPGLVLVVTQ